MPHSGHFNYGKETPVPIGQEAGWAGQDSCGKSCPHWDLIPGLSIL